MNHLHINCPHCGGSFELELQSETANMMIFSCARCDTPLMYLHGEVGELDREEFAGLRKKLTRAIDAAVNRDENLAPVADALRSMLDKSNEMAEDRSGAANGDHSLENLVAGEEAPKTENQQGKSAPKTKLTEESLNALQKELEELDVDSFLNQL